MNLESVVKGLKKKFEVIDRRLNQVFLRIYELENKVNELIELVGSGDYKARSKLNDVTEIIKLQTKPSPDALEKHLEQIGAKNLKEALQKEIKT